jgi:cell division protease FtsH
MIKRYGLSKKFRNMVFGDENEEVFLGYSMGQVQSYSDQTAAAIDEEIKQIIDTCYEDTKRILIEKKNIVEGLATRLIDKLTVDGPDFEKIYEANGDLSAVYPQDYSGIDTTSSVDVEKTEETTYVAPAPAPAPGPSESVSEAPADNDDPIEPGPTD